MLSDRFSCRWWVLACGGWVRVAAGVVAAVLVSVCACAPIGDSVFGGICAHVHSVVARKWVLLACRYRIVQQPSPRRPRTRLVTALL